MNRAQRRAPAVGLRLVHVAVASCFAGAVQANPSGPSIAAGSASVTTSGNTLTVTNVPGTIINWQQFSIRPDEVTRFIQQNAASAVLNRVTGGDPSALLGQLLSNGRVFLINPNGIAIGAGARIDTAGFVASSLNLSNEDFLAGKFRFVGDAAAGKVVNQGSIRAHSGGPVYLVAPTVENHGVITAPNGEILLAAGKSVELVAGATPHLRVAVTAPAGGEALNVGQLVAEAGQVGIYGAVVRNAGIVSASSASVNERGHVVLKASKEVALAAGSRVEADNSVGPGGSIIVYADDAARVHGELSARGGPDAKGGFIETSAMRVLDVAAAPDVGRGGEWLIDPYDITITATANQCTSLTGCNPGPNWTSSANSAQLGVNLINNALNAGSNVTIATGAGGAQAGNITFAAGANVSKTSGASDATLTLSAHNNINTGTATISSANNTAVGRLNVALIADSDTSGAGTVNVGGAVTTRGGSFSASGASITGASAIATTGLQGRNGGNVSLTAQSGGAVNYSGAITANGGTAAAGSAGGNAGNVAISGGTITVGAINAAGSAGAAGAFAGGSGGTVSLTKTGAAATAVTLNGAISVVGGNSTGTAMGGNGGSVFIDAGAGSIATTAANIATLINASGGTGQTGGSVDLDATGNINIATAGNKAIVTSGGAASTGNAGRNAGNITIASTGGSVTVRTLTAQGSNAAAGTNAAGGSGGAISISGASVTLNNPISAVGGNSVGTGSGGTGGAVTVTATSGTLTGATAATIATTGGRGQGGGNVTLGASGLASVNANVTTSGGAAPTGGGAGRNAGSISVTGGDVALNLANLTANGTAAAGANQAGGNGGAVTIDATDATPTITFARAAGTTISTTGAAATGSGMPGSGGAVSLLDATSIAGNLTITSTGSGAAAGGNVQTAAIDTSGATARTLTINAGRGAITLGAPLGATNALASVAASGQSVQVGSARTTGSQTYTGTNGVTLSGGTLQSTGTAAADTIRIASPALLTGATTVQTSGATNDVMRFDNTINGTQALTLDAGNGTLTLSGAVGQTTALASFDATAGAVTLPAVRAGTIFARSTNATGDVRLNGVLTATGGGDAVVLASARNFINSVGAAAINAGGGRWIIYSTNPASNTFGSLASGQAPVWGSTYAANPPAGIASGNRYVFSTPRTLTFTSTNAAKTYGDDATAAIAGNYTVSGFNTNTYGGVILADNAGNTFTGTPSVTSLGAATTAGVAGSPYVIDIGTGTLTPTTGYAFAFNAAGQLTVTPRAISVAANDQSKVYGSADPALTYSATGVVNGDTLNGTLARAPGETVSGGPYAITQGTLTNPANPNYTIAFTNGQLVITPKPIGVVADDKTKVYGSADPLLTFTATGLVGVDTLSGSLVRASGETVPGGPYAITQGTLANPNYSIAFTDGQLVITPKPISVIADDKSKVAGNPDPAFTYAATGLVSGDSLGGALTRAPGETVAGSPYAITQGTLSNPNYAIAFTDGRLTITSAPTPPTPSTTPAAQETAVDVGLARAQSDTMTTAAPMREICQPQTAQVAPARTQLTLGPAPCEVDAQ